MSKIKKDDTLCIVVTIIGTVLLMIAVHNARHIHPLLKYKSNLIAKIPKCYSKRHWKDRVKNSCMNCGHRSFITRHWDEDGLYCENCKKIHKGKIAKHYLYDKALKCIKCGHKDTIPRVHDESKINCAKCKMGHFDYYNKNVLTKKRK